MTIQHLDVEGWQKISKLSNLRKLSLRNTNLDDVAMQKLSMLDKLVHLNLVRTGITATGLRNLENLQNLQDLYLFQADLKEDEIDSIQRAFPKIRIDGGGYLVPTLKSDTTILTLESLN